MKTHRRGSTGVCVCVFTNTRMLSRTVYTPIYFPRMPLQAKTSAVNRFEQQTSVFMIIKQYKNANSFQ